MDMFYSLIEKLRKKRYTKSIKSAHIYGEGVRVNGPCQFTSNTYIGSNCHFNGIAISGNGRVTIGDNFHSGAECMIITQNHNYDHGEALPYDNTYITKPVTIGKNVWIGSRVIILAGAVIGDGAVVQAGSVVVGEIPALAVCGGHPAKVIKYRNKDHYDRLESEHKYW